MSRWGQLGMLPGNTEAFRSSSSPANKGVSMSKLYDVPLTFNDGSTGDFARFEGKVVMVVNVASQCGFTPQYAGLEALYKKYQAQGFEILGVPCNQFAGQEPGTDDDIAEFCEKNFGVTFPLTAKAEVRGKNQHPLYTQLTKFKNGILPGLIKWNFEKFLINRAGEIVARFAPTVEPESAEVMAAVEKALA